MYQKPRYQNTKPGVEQVLQVAYLLERECLSMDLAAGVEQHTVVIDFKGYSIFNAPPMSITKQVVSLLMDRYPERLGACFFVDAPLLMRGTWSIIKPLLPAATKAKVNFVKRSGKAGTNRKMDPAFAKVFEDHQLEEDFGGTLTSVWDFEKYWSKETEITATMSTWYAAGRRQPPDSEAAAEMNTEATKITASTTEKQSAVPPAMALSPMSITHLGTDDWEEPGTMNTPRPVVATARSPSGALRRTFGHGDKNQHGVIESKASALAPHNQAGLGSMGAARASAADEATADDKKKRQSFYQRRLKVPPFRHIVVCLVSDAGGRALMMESPE